MLVSLTVGKVDAGVTVLLTPDKRLIEFPSILLPPDISSGSIVDITVGQNDTKETAAQADFRALQDQIYSTFGAHEPTTPNLRCRNATQTSVVLEWDPIELATADLLSLSLYRNGQKAGNIPRPLAMHSTKISGLAVDTEYTFHLVLKTTAGTYASEKVDTRTHKMTDLSGITITTGIMPATTREKLAEAVERIGAKLVDGVKIDTTHFVTTEGRGQSWEKALETHIPVVRPEWVDACEKNGRILGVTKFYLDAMRPGPPHEEQPTTPAAQTPASDPQSQATPVTEESSRPVDPDEKEKPAPPPKDAEEDEEDSDEDDEPEQKAKAEAEPKSLGTTQEQDEQKVRLEDKEEQKVALRPAASNQDLKKDDEDDEDDDNDDTEDSGIDEKKEEAGLDSDDKGKPATTPGGASFEDVAL